MSLTHKILINATQQDELRVAIVNEKNQLIDLDIEQPGSAQKKANIYKGKISSIEPSLGAVFVDYGCEKHGFLPIKDISRESVPSGTDLSSDTDIRKALKIGQELVIQVEKEERGNKGAALSTFLSLAGSYLVLMPNNPRGGGISRRIEGDEREHLKSVLDKLSVPEGMSVIARTAGIGKTAEEMQWDLDILLQYWYAIKEAAIARPGPYLIHQESDVVIRAIRDYLRQDTAEIIIDDKQTYDRVYAHMEQVRPHFLSHLKLYQNTLPLFNHYHIEQQIENAFEREVILPSGATLVFDHTEALVAIDINSARATKGSNIEETAFNTNLEAAREIPRQLRIRDIGGLVMIDFIDMLSISNQRAVEDCIREHTKQDRARIQVGKISRFGILEMSRQRLNPSLNKNTQISCPSCHGRGTVRSVESLSLSVLRLIEEQSIKAGSAQIQVQLPLDHATYILNEKRHVLNEIQAKSQTEIVIIPNTHLATPQYQLKLIKDEHSKNTLSFKQVKIPKAESVNKKRQKIPTQVPAINQYLSTSINSKHPKAKKSSGDGLIKRIWDALFGANEPVLPPKKETQAQRRPKQTNKKNSKTSQRSDESRQQHKEASRHSNSSRPENQGGRSTSRRGSRGGKSTRNKSPKPSENKSDENGTKSRPQQSKTEKNANNEKPVSNTDKSKTSKPAQERRNSQPKSRSNAQSAVKERSEKQTVSTPVTDTPATHGANSSSTAVTPKNETKSQLAVQTVANTPTPAKEKTTPNADSKAANKAHSQQDSSKKHVNDTPSNKDHLEADSKSKPTSKSSSNDSMAEKKTPAETNPPRSAFSAKAEDYLKAPSSSTGMLKQIKTIKPAE